MFRLYFDRFDKDFNDKLETICVHFKSGRNLILFLPCPPIQSKHREVMVQPGPTTLGLPLIPSTLSLHSPEKMSVSSLTLKSHWSLHTREDTGTLASMMLKLGMVKEEDI